MIMMMTFSVRPKMQIAKTIVIQNAPESLLPSSYKYLKFQAIKNKHDL